MMRAAVVALAVASFAAPAFAQDYYTSTANVRHGNGYTPSTIVAGWEGDESFAIIALAPDGKRVAGQTAAQAAQSATDWKAIVITGPRAAAERDDEEDERYEDKLATNPKKVE